MYLYSNIKPLNVPHIVKRVFSAQNQHFQHNIFNCNVNILFFPSNCPILLYICSFAMACQESSYSTICSYLFLIFYNREMSRNKTNSYEMKSNYARFQILEPSKTIHTEQFVVLDAISSLIDHQPKKHTS